MLRFLGKRFLGLSEIEMLFIKEYAEIIALCMP